MSRVLALAGLLAGMLALMASVLERQGAHRIPIVDLIRDRFGRPRPVWLLGGSAVGALVLLAPVILAVRLGWARTQPDGDVTWDFVLLGFATALIKFVWAAIEELIFRGALLQQVSRRTNGLAGVAISSLLFAFAHLERSGSRAPEALSLLAIFLDGIGFALASLATRSLWMATLWHSAKNICIWLVFGESTLQLTHGLSRVNFTGPALWVGSANQAGLLDVIASGVGVVILAAVCGRAIARNRDWLVDRQG